jgi:hypothetical protein
MWWRLHVNLSQYRRFWQWRRTFRSGAFLLKRQEFYLSNRLRSTASALRIFWGLIRITYASFLLALGTATVLLIAEIFVPVPKDAGFSPIPLWHIEANDSYSSLLSTISGIGGVLIALYYSGMVAAGSSVYAKAPGVLRELLLREPIGKFFIQLVAFTTFLALCLLTFSAIGFSPIRFAFPLLILLSGVTVLSFVHLGQQAFNLFDPTRLAGSIFEDLETALVRVTAPNRFWEDPSFQWHANRQAAAALDALGTLATHAIADEYLKAGAIADVAVSTVNFLDRYEASKSRIPTKSKWFSTQFRHVDFYAADAHKADLAIRSGGSVRPEISQDEQWVERLAYDVVLQALASNLDESSQSEAIRIMNQLRLYSEHLGRNWQVDSATDLCLKVADTVFTVILTAEPKEPPAERPIANWQAALLEYLALMPIAALLGFIESVRQVSPETLDMELRKIRWGVPESLYRAHVEAFALPKIEWFNQRITFELQAEGKRVTPDWFILQLVSRDYLAALQSCTEALFRASRNGFQAWSSRFEQSGNLWGRAFLLNRHGEYLSKLSAHLHWIQGLEREFEQVKILPDLLGWPIPKSESFSANLASAQADQNRIVAEMALELSKVTRPDLLPDFAGQFLANTANHLVATLFDSAANDFQELFPVFWRASLAKFSTLFSDQGTTERDGYERFARSAAPLLDLVEISGFAILVSQLKETSEPWQALKDLWDPYFADPKAGASRIQIVDGALRLTDMPMISPGDMPRNQWRMQAGDWLRKELGIEEEFLSPSWMRTNEQLIHPRPLIRVLSRDTIPGMRRGSDIFGAVYFSSFLEEQKNGNGVRFHDLANSIRLETRRADNNPSKGEDVDE